MGMFQVKVVQICAQIFRLKEEKAGEELGDLSSLVDRHKLLGNFV